MTGPEHYLKAEELADQADVYDLSDHGRAAADRLLRRAAMHATLAQAAATAMAAFDSGEMHIDDYNAWNKACGVQL